MKVLHEGTVKGSALFSSEYKFGSIENPNAEELAAYCEGKKVSLHNGVNQPQTPLQASDFEALVAECEANDDLRLVASLFDDSVLVIRSYA